MMMSQLSLFALISLLMLGLASGFVVWPLWRTQPDKAGAAPIAPRRWSGIWLVTGLSLASLGLYTLVGEPDALVQHSAVAASEAAPGVDQARIEAMVTGLAQRLQKQPQDPEGWRMLAKSYETLGRFDQAVHAYQQLLAQQGPEPDLLTDYAVTLGMSKGQTLAGEPEALIKQALEINPKHIQALALSGSAAFEQGDYRRAVSQWQTLLSLIPTDAELRPSIARNVEKARSLIR